MLHQCYQHHKVTHTSQQLLALTGCKSSPTASRLSCTSSCAGQSSGQGGTNSLTPARVQQQAHFVSDRLRQELQTRSYLIQAQVC